MLNNITSVAPARICLYGDHQDYLNLPIIAIGMGEKEDDLQPFKADLFAKSLLSVD